MADKYYYLTSEGADTNLQLYSLRQALRLWRDLQNDYANYGEATEDLKERCVFALATLGLSISQLLGQNEPLPAGDVRVPKAIFLEFVDVHRLDPTLKSRFERFNYYYNGCRHFGLTTSGKGYKRTDELTFELAKECFEFGLEVWRVVVDVWRRTKGADLEEFDPTNLVFDDD